jgi:cellobiose phosphorylase
MADALIGNAERAWSVFRQMIPANAMTHVGADRYRAEPYAWVSNIVGPENPRFGWANVEQITGTAPWMDVVATHYLMASLEAVPLRPVVSSLF